MPALRLVLDSLNCLGHLLYIIIKIMSIFQVQAGHGWDDHRLDSSPWS